jgi:hypothetical protein
MGTSIAEELCVKLHRGSIGDQRLWSSWALDQQKPAMARAKGEINNRSANKLYAADD